MLKIEIGRGEKNNIEVSGSIIEIAAEIGEAVGHIYNILRQNGEGGEEQFRAAMMAAMLPMSPTWKERDVMKGAEKAECTVMVMLKEREK